MNMYDYLYRLPKMAEYCQRLLCEQLLVTIILPHKNILDKNEIILLLGDRDIDLKEKKGVLFY